MMMARTRSPFQTLKQRLMKHATPYHNFLGQAQLDKFPRLELSEFPSQDGFRSCLHGGFRCLLGANSNCYVVPRFRSKFVRSLYLVAGRSSYCVLKILRRMMMMVMINFLNLTWRTKCCNTRVESAKEISTSLDWSRAANLRTRIMHLYSTLTLWHDVTNQWRCFAISEGCKDRPHPYSNLRRSVKPGFDP